MSTRSIIVVHGPSSYRSVQVYRLYKHSDGYPTENLRIIAEAIERGNALVEESQDRFSGRQPFTSEMLTGLIIGAATSVYGMGAHLEHEANKDLSAADFGNQGDLEWIYIIDTGARTVKVYGGGYTGEGPARTVAKGTVNPTSYAKHLVKEAQAETRELIKQRVARVEAAGFKINPKVKA
jgi:hypothetical protein